MVPKHLAKNLILKHPNNKMRILLTLLALFPLCLNAQFDHESIHPDLSGPELYQALVEDYKPAFVLNYTQCRDTMYRNIYNENDTITAVYSGFRRFLEPSGDPSTILYSNANALSINTEHTYPQSKGASSSPAKSDMHHLFPTRTIINSARASDPFGDIPDEQTDVWFLHLDDQSEVPTEDIELYSEDNNSAFEPREDHKGNVARAMMYFYTMYRSEAVSADAGYFPQQQSILCQWHLQDPVDSLEWHRSKLIADYQDGKANPFVLDCSLAQRLYCDEFADCFGNGSTNVGMSSRLDIPELRIFPNPSNGKFNIELELEERSKIVLQILDSSGILVHQEKKRLKKGANNFQIRKLLAGGMYYCQFSIEARSKTYALSRRILVSQ